MIQPVFNTVLAATSLSPLVKVIDLVGSAWTLSNPSLNISIPAQLPSQVHLDLLANQVIGDPLFGLNNFNLRWVAWQNWTYTSDPILSISTDYDQTWLLFNGLDTFASVSLCGQHVANTNNQFRQYYYDVSKILRACAPWDRVLSLEFASAPIVANELASKSEQTWPPGVQQVYQFPNRWFIRKEQSDFGWDWGPAFAPAGPWQPASLVQLNNGNIHVRNSIVDVFREGQMNLLPPDQDRPWVVNVSLDLLGSPPAGVQMRYKLTELDDTRTLACGHLNALNVTESRITGMTTIAEDIVQLWWPVGMGAQTLYRLNVDVLSSTNITLATITKRIGFRTIVLNELPISPTQLAQGIAPGNNWHFEINGQEFYAKGSNFIPPDAFWPRVTKDKVQQLFDSVVAGNQNMLRVWASGAYSPDFLYDLADEMGILLWSEFEFGDALYPVDPDFLANVRDEAEYQVRRVNHHPSLALWAGGNELENLELALVNNSAPDQLPKYMAEYEKLFLETLSPVVFGNSRSIGYTPSSTSNGWLQLNFSNPNPITERYNNRTDGSIYGETDL
jgi:beta-mannosidase